VRDVSLTYQHDEQLAGGIGGPGNDIYALSKTAMIGRQGTWARVDGGHAA
jgi:hypothetical protein